MYLIYISGIDGCGKTTQARMLADFLRGEGLSAEYKWLRWEPSLVKIINLFKPKAKTSTVGKDQRDHRQEDIAHKRWVRIKGKLLSNILFKKLWLSYACIDYYFSLKKCFRNSRSDIWIIDRYLDDFVIDQSSNLGIHSGDFRKLMVRTMLKNIPEPNQSIIIDLPAEEGYKRKMDGTSLEYLQERRKRYDELPGSEDSLRLNGMRSVGEIRVEIEEWVKERLRKDKV